MKIKSSCYTEVNEKNNTKEEKSKCNFKLNVLLDCQSKIVVASLEWGGQGRVDIQLAHVYESFGREFRSPDLVIILTGRKKN